MAFVRRAAPQSPIRRSHFAAVVDAGAQAPLSCVRCAPASSVEGGLACTADAAAPASIATSAVAAAAKRPDTPQLCLACEFGCDVWAHIASRILAFVRRAAPQSPIRRSHFAAVVDAGAQAPLSCVRCAPASSVEGGLACTADAAAPASIATSAVAAAAKRPGTPAALFAAPHLLLWWGFCLPGSSCSLTLWPT